jgi:hypothetical protein
MRVYHEVDISRDFPQDIHCSLVIRVQQTLAIDDQDSVTWEGKWDGDREVRRGLSKGVEDGRRPPAIPLPYAHG